MNQQTNINGKKLKTIGTIIFVIVLLIGGIFLAREWQWLKIAKYLHKDAIPYLHGATPYRGVPSGEIPLKEALLFAIQHLENKGVKNIKIYGTEWITAPFGAYFIIGKGDFRIGDKHFSEFKIGVKDGSEGNAGEKIVFAVKGKDKEGRVIWYYDDWFFDIAPGFHEEESGIDYGF